MNTKLFPLRREDTHSRQKGHLPCAQTQNNKNGGKLRLRDTVSLAGRVSQPKLTASGGTLNLDLNLRGHVPRPINIPSSFTPTSLPYPVSRKNAPSALALPTCPALSQQATEG